MHPVRDQIIEALKPVQPEEPDDAPEPIRVITVRLPASMHEALRREAKQLSVELNADISMNKLCIEKLRPSLVE